MPNKNLCEITGNLYGLEMSAHFSSLVGRHMSGKYGYILANLMAFLCSFATGDFWWVNFPAPVAWCWITSAVDKF